MKFSSVQGSLPHQTGVTERSITDGDGHACDHVIKHVMIGHLADGKGAGLVAQANREDHFFRVELAGGLREELRAGDGMEHPLEIVEARHDGGESHEQQCKYDERLAPASERFPKREGENETGQSRNQSAEGSMPAQGHCEQERRRRLVTEGTNDEGGNKEEADGGKGKEGEHGPYRAPGMGLRLEAN